MAMARAQQINGHAMPEWHPLESIPRDGRTVEVIDGNGEVFLAKCINGRLHIDCEYLVQPTAWRLLL